MRSDFTVFMSCMSKSVFATLREEEQTRLWSVRLPLHSISSLQSIHNHPVTWANLRLTGESQLILVLCRQHKNIDFYMQNSISHLATLYLM